MLAHLNRYRVNRAIAFERDPWNLFVVKIGEGTDPIAVFCDLPNVTSLSVDIASGSQVVFD